MVDLPTAAEWDMVRNWLTTTGGVAALLVAASTYRRNVRIKREEQARLVYSKMTHHEDHRPGTILEILPHDAKLGNACPDVQIVPSSEKGGEQGAKMLATAPLVQITAVIHNGSKELIGPVKIQVVNIGRKITLDSFSTSIAAVDPESEFIVDFKWRNIDYPASPSCGTTIIFRDASGQWWRRHLSEPIEKVHNDPENIGPTPTERIEIRKMQLATGFEPIAEHKLTTKVRWHRFWRKRQGKSPIP